jgi:hypothetical protein
LAGCLSSISYQAEKKSSQNNFGGRLIILRIRKLISMILKEIKTAADFYLQKEHG